MVVWGQGEGGMNELKRLLEGLEREKFYGSLEVKIEAGRIVLIRQCQTFKPTEPTYGNNRSHHEQYDR